MTIAPISVIRDGAYVVVPRKDLVVGDIVLIEAGAEMPADGLIATVALRRSMVRVDGRIAARQQGRQHAGTAADPRGDKVSAARSYGWARDLRDNRRRRLHRDRQDRARGDRRDGEITPLNAQLGG
jgi:hypothetical protein